MGEGIAFIALSYFGFVVGGRLVLVGSKQAGSLLRGLRKGSDNPRSNLPDPDRGPGQ